MKALLVLLFALPTYAQEVCKVNESVVIKEQKEDINTAVPKELEEGQIILRTKDGKEQVLKTEEFKVVKRKQQFKVRERVIVQRIECEPTIVTVKEEGNKNIIMLGLRKDYIGLDKTVSLNSATVEKKRGLVLDLNYYRRNAFDSNIGLGIGLDSNEVIRGIIGLDF